METKIKPALQADSSHGLEVQKRRLRENCREFESVMISYMMKTMRNGLIRGQDPGSTTEMYEDMLAEQVAKQIGSTSALGIGDVLYSQLEHLVKTQDAQPEVAPAEAKTTTPATASSKPGSGCKIPSLQVADNLFLNNMKNSAD